LEENAERWHAASSRPSPLLELLSRTPRILAGITASASQRLARPRYPVDPPAPRYRLYRARSSVILPSLFRDCTGSAGYQTVQPINADLARSPCDRLRREVTAGLSLFYTAIARLSTNPGGGPWHAKTHRLVSGRHLQPAPLAATRSANSTRMTYSGGATMRARCQRRSDDSEVTVTNHSRATGSQRQQFCFASSRALRPSPG